MALVGCNLDEVNTFIIEIDKQREKVAHDASYRRGIRNLGSQYDDIRRYFNNFKSFLRYSEEASCNSFYRIRKSENGNPYPSVKDLKYPDPDMNHEDRKRHNGRLFPSSNLHAPPD